MPLLISFSIKVVTFSAAGLILGSSSFESGNSPIISNEGVRAMFICNVAGISGAYREMSLIYELLIPAKAPSCPFMLCISQPMKKNACNRGLPGLGHHGLTDSLCKNQKQYFFLFPSLYRHPLHLQSQQGRWLEEPFSCFITLILSVLLSSFLSGNLVIILEQEILLFEGHFISNLNSNCNCHSHLPSNITYSQVPKVQNVHIFGGVIILPTTVLH